MYKISYPEEIVKQVLEAIPALELLNLVNYHVEKIETTSPFEYRGLCPLHGETIFKTLILDDEKKQYSCTYNFCKGSKGGDFIDFLARVRDISHDDALKELGAKFAPTVDLLSNDQRIVRQLEVARNFLELSHFADAVRAFHDVTEADPLNVVAQEGLASAYQGLGDNESAATQLRLLLHLRSEEGSAEWVMSVCDKLSYLDPDNVDHYPTWIDAANRVGRDDLAIVLSSKLAAAWAENEQDGAALDLLVKYKRNADLPVEGVHLLVGLLLKMDRADEAREEAAYRFKVWKSEELQDDRRKLLFTLASYGAIFDEHIPQLAADIKQHGLSSDEIAGMLRGIRALADRSELAIAEKFINAIAPRTRGNLEFLELRADIFARLGHEEDSMSLYLEIVDKLIHDGKLEEAEARLDPRINTLEPSPDSLKRAVDLAEKKGNEEEAIACCRHWADRAKAVGDLGQLLAARERLISFTPDDINAHADFIDVMAQSGHKRQASLAAIMQAEDLLDHTGNARAIELLEKVKEALPESIEIHRKLADLFKENDEKERASASYGTAADIALEADDAPQARRLLNLAIESYPEGPDHYEKLIALLLKVGDQAEAVNALRSVAEVYVERSDWDAATRCMERLFELSPEDTGSLRTMAEIFGERDDNQGRQTEALLRLSEKYLENLSYKRALECLEKLLSLDPDNKAAKRLQIKGLLAAGWKRQAQGAMLNLAEQLEQEGDGKAALELLTEHEKELVDAVEIREQLIQMFLRQEGTEQALFHAGALFSTDHSGDSDGKWRELAESLVDLAPMRPEPRAYLLQLEKEGRDWEKTWNQAFPLIEIYKQNEKAEEAAKMLEGLLELAPNKIELHTMRYDLLKEVGATKEMTEAAIELAEQVVEELHGAAAQTKLISWLNRADEDCGSNQKYLEKAVELTQKVKATEAHLGYVARLSRALRERNRGGEALEMVEAALDDGGAEHPELLRELIDLYLEEQDIENAVAQYDQLLAALEEQGKFEEAKVTAQEAIGVKPDAANLRRRYIRILEELGDTEAVGLAEVELLSALISSGRVPEATALEKKLLARSSPPKGLEQARRKLRRLRGASTDSQPRVSTPARNTPSGDSAFSFETPSRRTPVGDSAFSFETPALGASGASFKRIGPDRPAVKLQTIAEYTFDNFIIGDSNQFAHATCTAVAKAPASEYNPLFLWGDVGVGKTHLINAIANYFGKHHPDLSVVYSSTEEFVRRLIDAIQSNAVTTFREEYRTADLLLIDDVQFLAGKERAQEEFFHLFNALFQSSRQIVLASDRPPAAMKQLPDRLVSRFSAGVIVDIQPPTVETRMALAQHFLDTGEIEYDDAVIDVIDAKVKGNVREIKGAATQLIAYARATKSALDAEQTERLLGNLYGQA